MKKKALKLINKIAQATAECHGCTVDFEKRHMISPYPVVNDPTVANRVQDNIRNMFGEELLGDCEKGNASYVTSGEIVDKFKAMVEKMFNGAATAKGALIIEPAKVIVTTPGPDNKKVI